MPIILCKPIPKKSLPFFKNQVVLTDYKMTGPGNFQLQLDRIYELLREFSARTQTPLHMDGLTRNILAFPGDYEYPVGCHGFV